MLSLASKPRFLNTMTLPVPVPVLIGIGFCLLSAVMTWITLDKPLVGAGMVFAMLYTVLAWRMPHIALMLIFAVGPFQNNLSGNALNDKGEDQGGLHFSLAEINLVAALPIFVLRSINDRRRMTIGPMGPWLLLHFAICWLSMALYWRDSAKMAFFQMFLYMVGGVAIFATFCPKQERLMLSLRALIVVGTFLACAQLALRSQFILGLHKNGIGGSISVAVVIAVELFFAAKTSRERMLLGISMAIMSASLVMILSRGAWLSTAVGVAIIAVLRREYGMLLRCGLVLIPVVAIAWISLPDESKDYAVGFGAERQNMKERYASIETCQAVFKGHEIIGGGFGFRKDFDATNIAWVTLAETGILGLLTFLAVQVAFLKMVWDTHSKLKKDDPLFSFVVIGGALVAGLFAHGMVDHYWSRGGPMMSWAAGGMAVGAWNIVRMREKAKRAMPALVPSLAMV
jgi:hypothetical protein